MLSTRGPLVTCSDHVHRLRVKCIGTGLSFALSLIFQALAGSPDKTTSPSRRLKSIDVVWAVRHVSCLGWYSTLIDWTKEIARTRGIDFNLTLYVSRGNLSELETVRDQVNEEDGDEVSSQEKVSTSSPSSEGVNVVLGRPNGAEVVREATRISTGRLVVVSEWLICPFACSLLFPACVN